MIHSARKKIKENRILFPNELKLAPDDCLDYGGFLSKLMALWDIENTSKKH